MSYKTHMGSKLYSVKDVAALISRGPSDQPHKLIRQVRHWTASDVLAPVGSKDTGTGVSRMYDADGVRCAAILLELSRYGIPVTQLEGFDEWTELLSGSDQWAAAVSGAQDVFLSMSWEVEADGCNTWQIGVGEPKWNALRRDLKPSRVKLHKGDEVAIPPLDLTSSIVINVTKIFARLTV